MTRPMTFGELRLAVLEIAAVKAMRAEAARDAADAATVRALLRRRVTRRLSFWSSAERAVWVQYAELQRSLRALGRESPKQHVTSQKHKV